jgi:hypothetical protein
MLIHFRPLLDELIKSSERRGKKISRDYAANFLEAHGNKLVDALNGIFEDIKNREAKLNITGRLFVGGPDSGYAETAKEAGYETADQLLCFLERNEKDLKEVAQKHWNSRKQSPLHVPLKLFRIA